MCRSDVEPQAAAELVRLLTDIGDALCDLNSVPRCYTIGPIDASVSREDRTP